MGRSEIDGAVFLVGCHDETGPVGEQVRPLTVLLHITAHAVNEGARFYRQGFMDDVAIDLGRLAKLDFAARNLPIDGTVDPYRIAGNRPVDDRIGPDRQQMRYHVTIDNTFELDVAIRFDIARDANILTEDRRRCRLFRIIGGRFPLIL